MNLNGISCQPIRQYSASQSFGARKKAQDDTTSQVESLKKEKEEWDKIAKNKDSKLMSSIGTVAVSGIAAAVSFCTFKAVAPKGFETIKKLYNSVTNSSVVKKTVEVAKSVTKSAVNFITEKSKVLLDKIPNESAFGKAKNKVAGFLKATKTKTSAFTNKIKTGFKSFLKKHNLDKAWFKEAALTGGGIAAAIPAGAAAAGKTPEESVSEEGSAYEDADDLEEGDFE